MKYLPEGYYIDVKDWNEDDIDKFALVTAYNNGCDVGCCIVEHTGGDDYYGDYRYMATDSSQDKVQVWVMNKEVVDREGYKEMKL